MKGLLGLGSGLIGATASAFSLKSDEKRAVHGSRHARVVKEPRMASKNLADVEEILHTISGVEDELFLEFYSGYYYNSSRVEQEEALQTLWEMMRIDGFVRLNDFYDILGLPQTKQGSVLGYELPIVSLRYVSNCNVKMLDFSEQPEFLEKSYHMYDSVSCADDSMFYLHQRSGEKLDIYDPITDTIFEASREDMVRAMGCIQDLIVTDGFATLLDYYEILEVTCDNPDLAETLGWHMPVINFTDCPNGAVGVELPTPKVIYNHILHGWEV